MLEKFLKYVEQGYDVSFSENPLIGTKITVTKYGHEAYRIINLHHAKDFGLDEDIVIMVTIEQLINEVETSLPVKGES